MDFDLNPDLIDTLKLKAITFAPSILYAVLILIAGFLANRIARRWLTALIARSRFADDLLLTNFFLRSTSFTILVLTFLTALAQLSFDVQTFVAGLGVTGLIVGFALKDTLSNFASGILLLIYRPFRAGELIEVEGSRGVVDELTIVNMQMTTTEGICVIMPNSKVWGSKIINYSQSRQRRLTLTLKVRTEDAEKAMGLIKAALQTDERILSDPPPAVRIEGISNNAAALSVTPWTDPKDFVATGADLYLQLKNALKEAGIRIL
ncbi:MAG TPA: mechanosensitive ion channel family protein [Blastocatellia bacterium]|nr:mechanosensitive ion channel family protein [Blastocatellia bacterium]